MDNTISIHHGSGLFGALARATAKVSLMLLTSTRVNAALGAAALAGLLVWLPGGTQALHPAAWTAAWTLHFAAMASIDIARKGGEL